jgi:hypothetical protein
MNYDKTNVYIVAVQNMPQIGGEMEMMGLIVDNYGNQCHFDCLDGLDRGI